MRISRVDPYGVNSTANISREVPKRVMTLTSTRTSGDILSIEFVKKYVGNPKTQIRILDFLRDPKNKESLDELKLLAEIERNEKEPDLKILHNQGIDWFFANLKSAINNRSPFPGGWRYNGLLEDGILTAERNRN